MTWEQSVEQALCFGWIDGVRRSLDEEAYTIRFTPRKQRSTWSAVNVAKVEELTERGLMRPAGLRAYERRTDGRTGVYSYERLEAAAFTPDQEERFRASEVAWEWFQTRPPGYRRTATHWVVSAKREETRRRRLETLIACSAEGRKIPPLTRPGEK